MSDPLGRYDIPPTVIVCQHGHYWRDYGDSLSMCPVSGDNLACSPAATYILDRLAPTSDPAAPLREALTDISHMLPGSIPLPMTEEEYLRSMLMQCVRTARAALATPAPKEADRE